MAGMRLFFVAAVIISVTGIKVPVENTDVTTDQPNSDEETSSEKSKFYHSDSEELDSYLVPPNPHQVSEESEEEEIATPATYLLPPSVDKESDYYKPTEAGEQTDWYPIAPARPLSRELLPPKENQENNPVAADGNESEPEYNIYGGLRNGKLLDVRSKIAPVPSRDLQPPLENAPNEYILSDFDEAINIPRPARPRGFPLSGWNSPIISVPTNIRDNSLPKISYNAKKNPTKLYPKKYAGAFKPIPIPLGNFYEDSLVKKQNDEPLKTLKPNKYISSSDDKKILKFEEAQQKLRLKEASENVEEPEASESNEDAPSLEQDSSASSYRVPSRNAYAAPLREGPKAAQTQKVQSHAPPPEGERTEFRMHGMKGPHSYQFGFDTGKGKNRQFRYEERDNEGRVKGHYGYMDKNGKLRVVNYDADPEHGFRAEPPVESE